MVVNFNLAGLKETIEEFPGIELVWAANRDEIIRLLADAEIFCTREFDDELLKAAPRLKWIHAFSGGVNRFIFPEFLKSSIELSCCKGVFDIAGAEHAIAQMLLFSRRIYYDFSQRFLKLDFSEYVECFELCGKTLGIVGLGSIGLELARKAHCLGMKVIGLGQRTPPDDFPFERILKPQYLSNLLVVSDFVAIAVPLTPDTKGMIGEKEVMLMKPTAYLIDVSGRDAIYDLDALVHALTERKIAGANMQMESPPPPDSSLWKIDSFHYSFHRATSIEQNKRSIDLLCKNLKRYLKKQPLLSTVDKKAGY